jgi:uncharacterized protein YecE (DUF72 family)
VAVTRIGTSGWRYKDWRGDFYPKGLVQKRELEYASARMSSLEINGTFYSLQRPKLFQQWAAETPPDFVFAVKGGRFITHMKKLREIDAPLANFFASGVLALEEKLGPFLWQLPEQLPFDEKRLDAFLTLLPRDTKAASALAKKHDHRLEGRSWTEVRKKRPIRHAIEIRHESYLCPDCIALLRRHRIALVFADTAQKFPYAEDLTADFLYLRLHGSKRLYASGYSDEELEQWAKRIRCWRSGKEPKDARRAAPIDRKLKGFPKDVYVYFDNTDVERRAPYDAIALMKKLASRTAS